MRREHRGRSILPKARVSISRSVHRVVPLRGHNRARCLLRSIYRVVSITLLYLSR